MRVHLRRVLVAVLVFSAACLLLHSFIQPHFLQDIASSTVQSSHHDRHTVDLAEDPVHMRHVDKGEMLFGRVRGSMGPQRVDGGSVEGPTAGAFAGWPLYAAYRRNDSAHLWPGSYGERKDRIVNQIHQVRPASDRKGAKLKKILMYSGLDSGMRPGQDRFIEHGCPVNQCSISDRQDDVETADLILFKDYIFAPPARRRPTQIWLLFMLESPMHTSLFTDVGSGVLNWTATYRRDSTLVAPYENFARFTNGSEKPSPEVLRRNYAKGKSKLVAWFVSNCAAPNGRSAYAAELGKHIKVDVYGSCGTMQCPRNYGDRVGVDECGEMLKKDYKFYLSFENSNCRDYVTEKLFWNALTNDVIPVVMGAPRADYELIAPPNSFIHVDDFASPRELAQHLRKIDADDSLYNSYFAWQGTGSFIDTKFWCRLCAMLHEAHRSGHHSAVVDLDRWWRGPGVCIQPEEGQQWASWRNQTSQFLPRTEEWGTSQDTNDYRQWTDVMRRRKVTKKSRGGGGGRV